MREDLERICRFVDAGEAAGRHVVPKSPLLDRSENAVTTPAAKRRVLLAWERRGNSRRHAALPSP